ncbi:MAG: hypothetical protein GY791_01385 [Alphaproteobacteria bacterium]|nr:hypothetical protein [Alphaproteobacteria bacterium]
MGKRNNSIFVHGVSFLLGNRRPQHRQDTPPLHHAITKIRLYLASFPEIILKPDLVAVPRDPHHSDLLIGFEVKSGCPKRTGEYAKSLKQAADYVLGRIVDPSFSSADQQRILNRTIDAVFLFPSYDESFFEGDAKKQLRLYGMHQLAAQFKVGRATIVKTGLSLTMGAGANDVWVQGVGWRPHARDRIAGKHQIGGQRRKPGN